MKRSISIMLIVAMLLIMIPNQIWAASDTEPPVTTIILTGNQGSNGIYYDKVTIELIASDNNSGVSRIQYRLNNGSWNNYSGKINLVDSKVYKIDYQSIDNNNNIEPFQTSTFTIKPDLSSPSTSIFLNGDLGENSFYIGPVSVHFTAIDHQSGIDYTEYSLDLGVTWKRYVSTFTVDDPEENVIYYRSKDKSGNMEKVKKTKVNMDTLPPSSPDIILDPDDWTNLDVLVSIAHGIDEESGVKKSQYRIGPSELWIDYVDPFTISEPGKVVFARSIDNAGNISDENSIEVKVDRNNPSEPEIALRYESDWTNEEAVVYITGSSDEESGFRRYEFKIDEGDWQHYAGPIFIEEEGIYNISARSMDWAGNYSSVVQKIVRYDGTAPTPPTTFEVLGLNYKQFTLNWSGEYDKIGVIGYDIYLDNVKIATTNEPRYLFKNLDANKEYQIEIIAFDEAENYSSKSSIFVVETLSKPKLVNLNYNKAGMFYLNMDGTVIFWRDSGVTQKVPINDVVEIKASEYATSIVVKKKDNTLWEISDSLSPVFYENSQDVEEINLDSGIHIIKKDGTVWKYNVNTKQFEKIPNLENIVSLTVESGYLLALDKTGVAWGYGVNFRGQLGDGTIETRATPVKVLTNQKFKKLYTRGEISAGIGLDGGLYMWGSLRYMERPVGSVQYLATPGRVTYDNGRKYLENVVDFIISQESLWALDATGNVWAWGYDVDGRLGLGVMPPYGTRPEKTTPNLVNYPQKVGIDNVSRIFKTEEGGVLAVKRDGSVWAWGKNSTGYSATGDKLIKILPTRSMYPTFERFENRAVRDGEYRYWYYNEQNNNVVPLVITKPNAPTTLEITQMSDNSFHLSWIGQTDYNYEIFINNKLIGSTAQNDFLIQNLLANQSYVVKVRAVNEMLYVSDFSEGITIETINDTLSPSVPANLSTYYISSNKIGIEWEDSIDNFGIDHYEVLLDSDVVIQTKGNKFLFNNLLSDNEYTFKIRAVDLSGNKSDFSDLLIVKTDEFKYDFSSRLAVSSTSNFVIFVKEDNTVWSWGANDSGQLGDGSLFSRSNIAKVEGLNDVIAVAVGTSHSLALKSDGTVWSWGDNSAGQLGDNSNVSRSIPQQISGLENIERISASGKTSFALQSDGTLWAWGNNSSYQLGDKTNVNRNIPTAIEITDVSQIISGNDVSFVVKQDGTLWGWGGNYKLGKGSSGAQVEPIVIQGLSNIKKVIVGDSHVLAMEKDGTVWSWGLNNFGQLGRDGSNLIPGIVTELPKVKEIGIGASHSLAVKEDGGILVWGLNRYGQFGIGNVSYSFTLVPINEIESVVYATGGTEFSVLLKEDGSLWTSGYNITGQLADGTIETRHQFDQVKENNSPVVTLKYPNGTKENPAITNITTPVISWIQQDDALTVFTNYQVEIRKEDGTLYFDTGEVEWANKGNRGTWDLIEPLEENEKLQVQVRVKDGRLWSEWSEPGWIELRATAESSISSSSQYSLLLKPNGTVWSWGDNSYSQLGDGTKTKRSSVEQIEGLSNVIAVSAGSSHGLALKADGTVWSWGGNFRGQLGDGSTTDKLTPFQVPNLTGVVSIAAGEYSSFAVKSDGTVWAWGDNSNYTLGDQSTTNRTSPVEINIGGVKRIVSNTGTTFAIKMDGTVWGWGSNTGNKLARGGGGVIHAHTQLATLSNVIEIAVGNSHVFALKEDGTLWSWGTNTHGELGIGGATSTPQFVPGMTDVRSVNAGSNKSLAVKEDGSVWVWGYNNNGELGTGNKVKQTAPLQLSGIAGAMQVSGRGSFSVLLKEDGSFWATGNNTSGELGDGTNVSRLEFVQVKENSSPVVTLQYPKGMEGNPTVTNIPTPVVSWNQQDDAFTIFTKYQVQIRKEDGSMHEDSGEQNLDSLEGTGGWRITSPLPENEKLQVQVRVKDGRLWSEWSEPGWIELRATAESSISSSTQFSLALKPDGTVWSWGVNSSGQLGDGTKNNRSSAEQIEDLSSIIAVEAGSSHGLALKADGTVWSWGSNLRGQLGDGSTTDKLTPFQVPNLTDVVSIAAGEYSSFAIKSDGTVWAWGENNSNQLGDQTVTNRTSPVKINIEGVRQIVSNTGTTFAIKMDGTVWGWGSNAYNKLAREGGGTQTSPTKIGTLSNIKEMVVGYSHVLALKEDGTLMSWGVNAYGELGRVGTTGPTVSTPQFVPGMTDVRSVNAGSNESLAVKEDGSVWVWGYNNNGELGTGNKVKQTAPLQLSGITGAKQVSGRGSFSVLLKEDGSFWATGNNTSGELGDGTNVSRLEFVQVKKNSNPVVILQYPKGTEGNSTVTNIPTPVVSWNQQDDALTVFTKYQVQIRKEDGSMHEDSGEQNLDSLEGTGGWRITSPLPENEKLQVQVRVKDGRLWSEWSEPGWIELRATAESSISSSTQFSLALKPDGTVWSWGGNSSGQLGDGTKNNRSSAEQIEDLSSIIAVEAGSSHGLALKADGTVWSWGSNLRGQLGDGSTTDKLTPFQVPNLTDVVSIAAGEYSSFAIKSDGTVWAWGENNSNQLGDQTATNRTSPVKINIEGVRQIVSNTGTTFAIKMDGTVWGWGSNAYNKLAREGGGTQTSPTKIGTLSNIKEMVVGYSHVLALKEDGTLMSWGVNTNGELGRVGTTGPTVSMPQLIPGMTDVKSLNAGTYKSLAVKEDGSVWVWGYNNNGELGTGNKVKQTAPLQLSGITGAKQVSGKGSFSVLLKADGSIWATGYNTSGQLGDGTTLMRFVFVQVIE